MYTYLYMYLCGHGVTFHAIMHVCRKVLGKPHFWHIIISHALLRKRCPLTIVLWYVLMTILICLHTLPCGWKLKQNYLSMDFNLDIWP